MGREDAHELLVRSSVHGRRRDGHFKLSDFRGEHPALRGANLDAYPQEGAAVIERKMRLVHGTRG